MIALRDRRLQPEWMDDPALDPNAHRRALNGLARLNGWSGSAAVLWREIRTLRRARSDERPLQLLDVACGGGDVTLGIWWRARRAGLPLQVVGCDASALALTVARERAAEAGADIDWRCCDVLRDEWPAGFDVVTSSLFLHHLEPSDAVAVLRRAAHAADSLRMLDLSRNLRGWLLARASTWLLTRSPVVRCDGPRSVEGAFTPAEAAALSGAADLANAQVVRRWPARWLLRWDRRG